MIAQVPRDHSWLLLNAVDHVPMEAISNAVAAQRCMQHHPVEPVRTDDEAVWEMIYLLDQAGSPLVQR